MINSAVCNILNNNESDIDIQECFDEIFSGLCNPILSAVFLSLLKTKEQTLENILAGVNSARNTVKKINLGIDNSNLIENICLDNLEQYIDITFATDIICSACNLGAVKTMIADCLSKNNSFNTLKAFGINIESLKSENFDEIKFMYGYVSEQTPYYKYTHDIYRALPYDTILNIINYFLNQFGAKNCTIALLDKNKIEKYAQLCLNLGYNNSIVFSGGDFPYVSIENETKIAEAWKNKIFTYTVTPELLGIKQNSIDTLRVENSSHGAEIIQAIFENKLKDSYYDAITINSGLALYITKKTKSLMEGIGLARKTIDDGLANNILLRIKNQNPSDFEG